MKIYIITKPGTNEVYIGQTKLELKVRLNCHFQSQKKINSKLYKWLDKSCIIEIIEEFDGNKDIVKEMNYIKYYEDLGMSIINTNKGQSILDPEVYRKNKTVEYKESGRQKEIYKKNKESGIIKERQDKYRANGKLKEWSDKSHTKSNPIFNEKYKSNGMKKKWNDNKHPEYNTWSTTIAKSAKKEGLKAKEYRKKYNIPDYTGPKKRN